MSDDSAHGRAMGSGSGCIFRKNTFLMVGWVENLSRPSRARRGPVDGCAMAYASTKLSELQNGASTLPDLVPRRDLAAGADGCCQRASPQTCARRRRMLHRCDLRNGYENHGDC